MIYWLIPLFLGAGGVLQAGLNRQLARESGLSLAVLLNGALLTAVAALVALVSYRYPQLFPAYLPPRWEALALRWWLVVPALCGVALLIGIPALIPKLGATGVFLCIVVGQMLFSLLWDQQVERLPLDPRRIAGVGLALAGLLLASWRS